MTKKKKLKYMPQASHAKVIAALFLTGLLISFLGWNYCLRPASYGRVVKKYMDGGVTTLKEKKLVSAADEWLRKKKDRGAKLSELELEFLAEREIDSNSFKAVMALSGREPDYETAAQSYVKILSFDPDNEEALSGLAAIFAAMDNYDKAAEYCQSLISKYPNKSNYYILLAELQNEHSVGDPIETLESGIGQIPDSYDLNVNLAYYYSAKGDDDASLEKADRATDINPSGEWAYRLKGRVYHKKGELAKAREAYQMANELNPDDETARQFLRNFDTLEYIAVLMKFVDDFAYADSLAAKGVDETASAGQTLAYSEEKIITERKASPDILLARELFKNAWTAMKDYNTDNGGIKEVNNSFVKACEQRVDSVTLLNKSFYNQEIDKSRIGEASSAKKKEGNRYIVDALTRLLKILPENENWRRQYLDYLVLHFSDGK
ncbi:MAG: tetratricopeptide repeat protein [Candidatus Omnitrophica bacterium]|nr:tetratricopeptide repeat protein [Candidatus Omnitrophota bacterium]